MYRNDLDVTLDSWCALSRALNGKPAEPVPADLVAWFEDVTGWTLYGDAPRADDLAFALVDGDCFYETVVHLLKVLHANGFSVTAALPYVAPVVAALNAWCGHPDAYTAADTLLVCRGLARV